LFNTRLLPGALRDALLEHAGTPESLRALENLAGGLAEARLTREAKASLDRRMKR
jgi:hypothetical protein